MNESADGILVRSYEVRNTTVRRVIAFYEDLLADRPVVQEVTDAPGEGEVLRGEWRLDEGTLRVTTQVAPTVNRQGGINEPTVQLSLQLTPS